MSTSTCLLSDHELSSSDLLSDSSYEPSSHDLSSDSNSLSSSELLSAPDSEVSDTEISDVSAPKTSRHFRKYLCHSAWQPKQSRKHHNQSSNPYQSNNQDQDESEGQYESEGQDESESQHENEGQDESESEHENLSQDESEGQDENQGQQLPSISNVANHVSFTQFRTSRAQLAMPPTILDTMPLQPPECSNTIIQPNADDGYTQLHIYPQDKPVVIPRVPLNQAPLQSATRQAQRTALRFPNGFGPNQCSTFIPGRPHRSSRRHRSIATTAGASRTNRSRLTTFTQEAPDNSHAIDPVELVPQADSTIGMNYAGLGQYRDPSLHLQSTPPHSIRSLGLNEEVIDAADSLALCSASPRIKREDAGALGTYEPGFSDESGPSSMWNRNMQRQNAGNPRQSRDVRQTKTPSSFDGETRAFIDNLMKEYREGCRTNNFAGLERRYTGTGITHNARGRIARRRPTTVARHHDAQARSTSSYRPSD